MTDDSHYELIHIWGSHLGRLYFKTLKPFDIKGLHGVVEGMRWVLPPLSNSWIIFILWLYIALNRIPNIDCY